MSAGEADEELSHEDALGQFSTIDWASYSRVGLLSSSEVSCMTAAESAPLDYTLKEPTLGKSFAQALLKVVGSVSDIPAQQYALTRLCDVLMAEDCGPLEDRVEYLLRQDGTFEPGPFLKSLHTTRDEYAAKCAASVLATMLAIRSEVAVEEFVSWLCEQLSSWQSEESEAKAAVPALTILLRADRARPVFAAHGGVGYVTKLLKRSRATNAQTRYELTFCLWTLSFSPWTHEHFYKNASIEALVDQIAAAPREKVVRVSLATLRNLCGKAGVASSSQGAAARMIKCGLPKTLRTLRERPWTDPDVVDDIEILNKTILSNYRELSSWDKYLSEVESGDLDWGLTHTDAFWKENVRLAEADDFSLVKSLVALLAAEDPKVVAISCYDLGEFVRFYPNGKTVLKHIGAKQKLVALIEHPSHDVQRHALQCVSKMLVSNWEFLEPTNRDKK